MMGMSPAFSQVEGYDTQELEDLRGFLRQPSAEEGKANFEQFRLSSEDTATWYESSDWLNRLQLTWKETDGVKYLSGVNWFSKKLGGVFSLPHCPGLETVNLASNDLVSAEISSNTALISFGIATNAKVTALDVSQNTALETLTISSTGITEVDLSKNPNLKTFTAMGGMVSGMDFSHNPLLENVYLDNCTELRALDFSNNLSLSTLNVVGCTNLTELDLSSLGSLGYLYVNNTGIRELDLSTNTRLTNFQGYSAELESLILPDAPGLQTVYAYDNHLSSVTNLEKLSGLKDLRLDNNELRVLDVSGNTALTNLDVHGNLLEDIVGLENLTELVHFYCYDNRLSDLSALPTPMLRTLHAYGNDLRLSTLPTRAKPLTLVGSAYENMIGNYWFWPQNTRNGGAVLPGSEIDLSSEASKTFEETTHNTVFAWFDITDGNETAIELPSSETGVFTVGEEWAGKTLRCKMTNAFYTFNNGQESEDGFPFVYEIHVAGDAAYAANEVDQIKAFLRQASACEGQSNAAVLGVDTTAWAEGDLWLHALEGLRLSGQETLHVVSVDWDNRDLAGELDLSGFAQLDSLDVTGNALTALVLDECPALRKIHCQDNALRFSTLPKVEAEVFEMAPQAGLNLGRVNYSDGIDLRSENDVVLNGETTMTEYRWVVLTSEGETETTALTNTDGLFIPDTSLCGKNLRVYMTNEAYWGETSASQLTLSLDVFVEHYVEPEYAEAEVEALKSFLRQASASGGANFTRLGLTDTASWNENTAWIDDLEGMSWEVSGNEYRLVDADWNSRGLAGALDFSGFGKLREFHASNNNLTSIDLSGAGELTDLRVFNNPGLSSLDLGNCPALEMLYVQNCALESLDVFSCDALRQLQAFDNRLQAFDASGLTRLSSVYLYGNELESVNFFGCEALASLDVSDNRLTALDVENCPALSFLKCGDNALTFATLPKRAIASYDYAPQAVMQGEPVPYTAGIDLSQQKRVVMPGEEAVITEYAWFDISTDEEVPLPDSLSWLVDDGNGRFTLSEVLTGTDLRCKMRNAAFPDLELEYEISLLETLEAYDEAEMEQLRAFLRHESVDEGILNAEKLGLSLADTLEWETSGKWIVRLANYGYVSLTRDEATGKKRLTGIDFVAKNLAGDLVLTACTELTGISCFANKLTGLDVSNSTKMGSIWCYNNEIPELDVSKLNDLVYLYCDQNKLKSLDLTNHPDLLVVRCGWNELEHLDVSGCTFMFALQCQNNQLEELDVTQNTKLTDLFVSNNFLTELDLSRNPELSEFHGSYNYFTFFDFATYNKMMWHLYLDHNLLEGIVLTDLVIETVDIRYNELTFSTIPFDFTRKDYYFAPQDTVDLGKFPADGTLDLTSEYMLDTDGSHSFFEWQVLSGGEYVETDDVIVMDETGLFVFDKDAEGKSYRCVITSNNVYRSALTMEYYVDVVEPTSRASAADIEVSVYPNPVLDELHVASSCALGTIRLFDMNGRVVYQHEADGLEHQIDMESYPAGMYFLDVDGLLRKKVVKR